MRATVRRTGAIVCALAMLLAGCSTSPLGPATAEGLRAVVGTDLIGARGATPKDQRKINSTVAGVCGAGIWKKSECARHGEESRNPPTE